METHSIIDLTGEQTSERLQSSCLVVAAPITRNSTLGVAHASNMVEAHSIINPTDEETPDILQSSISRISTLETTQIFRRQILQKRRLQIG
ncbi:hypothetical protein BJX63DRAFT_417107 [Aspergillus granulosus]|uniref:Uncharacterized protein n=1 Tax=Aspergillus granulosus TaxID=176169 RepID=A0ABR4GR63_9EURO